MYDFFKFIHVLSVIIFLGNITIGVFWKQFAEKKKDPKEIAFTFQGIIKADRVFTMPSILGILVGGFGAAGIGYLPILETGWIMWSFILLIISGAVFMSKVVPVQKKIFALASDEAKFTWDEYNRLVKDWNLWGTVATISPYIAVVLMIFKP
jgi:uncharacterized membrane protein